MKRRTFMTTLTALGASPALPASVLAAPSPVVSQHFAKAKLLARCHDRASPEMFQRLMQLDRETAQGVFAMLKDQNVVANCVDGVTRAINPLNTHCVPNEALRARDFTQVARDVSSRLREMAKERLEGLAEEAPQQEVDAADQPLDPPVDDGPPERHRPLQR